MAYDTRPTSVPIQTKPNTSRVWRADPSGALLPVGTRATGKPEQVIVRTAWSSTASGTGDYASPATDNTWLTLPLGRFDVPSLRRIVLVKWDIIGDYSNPLGDAESIETQLMVDGSAVDTALAYTQTAAVTTTGALRFTADLTAIGTLTSQRFLLSTKMLIVNASGTSIIATEIHRFPTINALNEQTLGWRIRKTATGGGTTVVMNIHSVLCYQLCPASGV